MESIGWSGSRFWSAAELMQGGSPGTVDGGGLSPIVPTGMEEPSLRKETRFFLDKPGFSIYWTNGLP